MFPLLEVVQACHSLLLPPFKINSSVFKTTGLLQELQVLQELLKRYHLYKGGGGGKGHGISDQAQGEGLGNPISVAGVGHVISNPQYEIPTPPSPLLISDKSLM